MLFSMCDFYTAAKQIPGWAVFNFGTSSKRLMPARAVARLYVVASEMKSGTVDIMSSADTIVEPVCRYWMQLSSNQGDQATE